MDFEIFPQPMLFSLDFLPHISRTKFNNLMTKSKAMQLICKEAKILKIQRKRGRYLGINKILVTTCMNVCNMSPKESCNFHHLFDSLPQGNWFELRGNIQE